MSKPELNGIISRSLIEAKLQKDYIADLLEVAINLVEEDENKLIVVETLYDIKDFFIKYAQLQESLQGILILDGVIESVDNSAKS